MPSWEHSIYTKDDYNSSLEVQLNDSLPLLKPQYKLKCFE